MIKRVKAIIFLALIVGAGLYQAGTALAENAIELEDGTVLVGTISALSANKTDIYFIPADPQMEPRWIPLADIKKISFDPIVKDIPLSAPLPE